MHFSPPPPPHGGLAAVRGSIIADLLFIVTPNTESVFCCTLLYVHSGFAIILIGRRALLFCLVCPPGVI